MIEPRQCNMISFVMWSLDRLDLEHIIEVAVREGSFLLKKVFFSQGHMQKFQAVESENLK